MSKPEDQSPEDRGEAVCSARSRCESDLIRSEVYRWIARNHPDGFIDSLSYSANLDRCREHAERYVELHGDVARAAMRLVAAIDRYAEEGRWEEIKNAMPRLRAALPSMFEDRSGQRSRCFSEQNAEAEPGRKESYE